MILSNEQQNYLYNKFYEISKRWDLPTFLSRMLYAELGKYLSPSILDIHI